MNLNIYLYKVKKFDGFDPTKIYSMKEFNSKLAEMRDYNRLVLYFFDEDLQTIHPILKQKLSKVTIYSQYVDIFAIAKTLGIRHVISSDIIKTNYGYKVIINDQKIELLDYQINRYLKNVPEERYVYELKEMAHQVKTNDEGWHYLKLIGNRNDSFLSLSVIKEMFLKGCLDESFVKNWDCDCFFEAFW